MMVLGCNTYGCYSFDHKMAAKFRQMPMLNDDITLLGHEGSERFGN